MRYYVKITKKDPKNNKVEDVIKSSALDYATAMKIIEGAYERHGDGLLAVCLTSDLDQIVARGLDPERAVWSTPDGASWNCESCGYYTHLGDTPEACDYGFCPRCGKRISHYEYPDGSMEEVEHEVSGRAQEPK